jgi:uncharacterized membrane protein
MTDPTVESGVPVQLMSIIFPGNEFTGAILPELDRLKKLKIVRILDMLLVRKDENGNILTATASDLEWEEAMQFGAYAGALAALARGGPGAMARGEIAGAAELADGHIFDDHDAFNLTQVLQPDSTGVLLLLEHEWSQKLLDSIHDAGGVELFNTWVHPAELISKPETGEEFE